MKILLTGSSGWLGRFLAPKLRSVGHDVVGLDVAVGKDTEIVGSVADADLIDRSFADHGIEVVIHSGALHKPDIIRFPPRAFVDVNVTGTLNLLEAAKRSNHNKFIFTSTTSLMISEKVRAGKDGGASRAVWLDEESGPLRPRNIYGVTKLAAEHLCRLYSQLHDLDIAILRTGRFFPEDDDTHSDPSGPNLKANEFLNRRLTVEDAADAHIAALDKIAGQGCETFILSAPTPFEREECERLMSDAESLIAEKFPAVAELYARHNWVLPDHIDRVYDAAKAERILGFRPKTDFASILSALEDNNLMPFHHDPNYISPQEMQK